MVNLSENAILELLSDLRTHFANTGWRRVSHPNKKTHLYKNLNVHSDLELYLPASHEYVDSDRRIMEVVRTLSQLADETEEEFLRSLQRFSKDALLFRIRTDHEAESIPLEYAEVQISGMKKLMLYTASSESVISPYHSRPTTEANHFTEQCEFGHTFRGSFGFSVLLRILKSGENMELLDSPFSRRVFERLGNGLRTIDDAIKQRSTTPIVENYETGLNSRMCDALSEISANGRCEYSIDIDWASMMVPPEHLLDIPSVEVTPEVVEMLDEASLKLKHVPPSPFSLTGYVANLHCISDPKQDDVHRKILIVHDHSKYGRIEVGIELSKESYIAAVEAHRDRKELKIQGVLQRIGASWSLHEINEFQVLPGN